MVQWSSRTFNGHFYSTQDFQLLVVYQRNAIHVPFDLRKGRDRHWTPQQPLVESDGDGANIQRNHKCNSHVVARLTAAHYACRFIKSHKTQHWSRVQSSRVESLLLAS